MKHIFVHIIYSMISFTIKLEDNSETSNNIKYLEEAK